MKTIHCLLFACCMLTLTSCSDKIKASAKVTAKKAEDSIVEAVGKGNVALQLHRDKHDQGKRDLQNAMAQVTVYEKKLSVIEEQLADPSLAKEKKELLARQAERYGDHVEKRKQNIKELTAALKESKEGYELLKMRVELAEEELAMYQSAARFNDSMDVDSLTGDIKDLVESLEADVARAEAAADIANMDLDL